MIYSAPALNSLPCSISDACVSQQELHPITTSLLVHSQPTLSYIHKTEWNCCVVTVFPQNQWHGWSRSLSKKFRLNVQIQCIIQDSLCNSGRSFYNEIKNIFYGSKTAQYLKKMDLENTPMSKMSQFQKYATLTFINRGQLSCIKYNAVFYLPW